MTEEQIKHLVERFLGWRLPDNFNPDNGISYARPNYAPGVDATPTGTNLFDYTQAEAMIRHITAELPSREAVSERLVQFFYLLGRDELGLGQVNGLIQKTNETAAIFSDPDLESWARKRAARFHERPADAR